MLAARTKNFVNVNNFQYFIVFQQNNVSNNSPILKVTSNLYLPMLMGKVF
jgi:hypothetical protein